MPRIDVSLEIPKTGSPVPGLCSVHATDGRGQYGDPSFRGNCSGALIRDVLEYFQPNTCLDPMEGSGTCRDVCQELGIHYDGFDLSGGFDALELENYSGAGILYDFIWLHPPYWDLLKYNDDPRCLSRVKTLGNFLDKLIVVIGNCLAVLSRNGHLAILIGDITRRGNCSQLPFLTWQLASLHHGLRLAVPEIIRLQHGATSTKREYAHAFIPRLHDVLMIFKQQ